jgi:hypothetical protein
VSIARWIFTSPLRAVLTALAITGAALGALVIMPGNQPADVRPAAPVTLAPLDPEAATELGQDFVALWCEQGDRTPDQWAAEMRARSTPEFGAYWTPTAVENLSGDCPYGQAKPRLTEAARVRVFVVTKGNPVLVDVVQTAAGPRVAGIVPDDEGDL